MDLYVVLVVVLFVGIPLALAVWAIVDVVRFRGMEQLPTVLWIAGIVLFPVVGALMWLALGRRVMSSNSSPNR